MEKCAVVLGASTGTGAAIAKALAFRAGQNILGFHRGRHELKARDVQEDIKITGLRCTMYNTDVGTSYEAVQNALSVVAAARGKRGINTFVHAISGASIGDILDMPPEKIERTFNTMAHSFLWWARGLVERELLAYNATLIALTNVTSDGSYVWNSGAIGASKAALEAYVKLLAVRLGFFSHRVFAVKFGTILTPAVAKVTGSDVIGDWLKEVHKAISPYSEMQTPEEVAHFVASLVLDNSRGLNGAVIDFTAGTPLTLWNYAFTPK